MVKITIGDEVGWPEGNWTLTGTVTSEPNEIGEFYVYTTDPDGDTTTRSLDALGLPKGFVNITEERRLPGLMPPSEFSGVVITKPQKQSLWPYVLFMVAGGALIINI